MENDMGNDMANDMESEIGIDTPRDVESDMTGKMWQKRCNAPSIIIKNDSATQLAIGELSD